MRHHKDVRGTLTTVCRILQSKNTHSLIVVFYTDNVMPVTILLTDGYIYYLPSPPADYVARRFYS